MDLLTKIFTQEYSMPFLIFKKADNHNYHNYSNRKCRNDTYTLNVVHKIVSLAFCEHCRIIRSQFSATLPIFSIKLMLSIFHKFQVIKMCHYFMYSCIQIWYTHIILINKSKQFCILFRNTKCPINCMEKLCFLK